MVNAAVAVALLVEVAVHTVFVSIDGGFGQNLFVNAGMMVARLALGTAVTTTCPLCPAIPKTGVLWLFLTGTPAYVGPSASTVPESRWSLSSGSILRICWTMRHAVLYVTPNSRSNCFAGIPQRVEAILKIA